MRSNIERAAHGLENIVREFIAAPDDYRINVGKPTGHRGNIWVSFDRNDCDVGRLIGAGGERFRSVSNILQAAAEKDLHQARVCKIEQPHGIHKLDALRRLWVPNFVETNFSIIAESVFPHVSDCWISHNLPDVSKSYPITPNTVLLTICLGQAVRNRLVNQMTTNFQCLLEAVANACGKECWVDIVLEGEQPKSADGRHSKEKTTL